MDAEPSRLEGRFRPGALSRVLSIAFAAFSLAMALSWANVALPRYLPKPWSAAHEYDAFQDWLGARLYVQGESPYTAAGLAKLNTVAYGHPPSAPFWLVPLARLDKPIAAELVDLGTWFVLIIHLYVCAREVKFPAPKALTVLLFGWILTTAGFVNHWHAIQSSEYIAAALVASWVFLRQNRQVPAGVAMAIAATLKLFPGVLMLFLLVARRWRAFVAATAAYVLVGSIMTATFGLDSWWLFLKQQGPVADNWLGSMRNASLHGIVYRLTTSLPRIRAGANYIVGAVALSLFALSSVLSRDALRRARDEDARAVDIPFALFTVLAVFVNPWVWEHYFVLLIQPAFVVANSSYLQLRGTFRRWLDDDTSLRTVFPDAFAFALGAIGIAATAKLLKMQDIRADRVYDTWAATRSAWAYRQLRLYEWATSLPWIIMLVVCLFTVRLAGRSGARNGSLRIGGR